MLSFFGWVEPGCSVITKCDDAGEEDEEERNETVDGEEGLDEGEFAHIEEIEDQNNHSKTNCRHDVGEVACLVWIFFNDAFLRIINNIFHDKICCC